MSLQHILSDAPAFPDTLPAWSRIGLGTPSTYERKWIDLGFFAKMLDFSLAQTYLAKIWHCFSHFSSSFDPPLP